MNAIEQLKSVLCDHAGKCSIIGSDEDRAIVDRALQALAAQPVPAQPVAHIVGEIDHTGKVWKPVQPAPVPLTDDPLQGAVDWLLQADGEYFCTANVQRTLRIGYNRAKRLCDTAKERAAHGIAAAPKKGQP